MVRVCPWAPDPSDARVAYGSAGVAAGVQRVRKESPWLCRICSVATADCTEASRDVDDENGPSATEVGGEETRPSMFQLGAARTTGLHVSPGGAVSPVSSNPDAVLSTGELGAARPITVEMESAVENKIGESEGGDIGTCVPVGTRPFGRPSHARICRGGCGRAARSQGTPTGQIYLFCCDGCFFGWGHDADCTEASRDGVGETAHSREPGQHVSSDSGPDTSSKSPYEWGSTAHGTVGPPAFSTSPR